MSNFGNGFALRREGLYSAVGLHAIGAGILAVAVIGLGIRVGLDWRATSSSNQDAMASREADLRTLQIQTAPLRGLDKKVDLSRDQIDQFYDKRVPPHWSSVLERLGELQASTKVRLSRIGYTPAPGSGDLTEIRMDAGVSGEYPQIMRFINGLERSQTFFVIRAMALTGQQSGTVNLRLVLSTWLRPSEAGSLPVAGAGGPGSGGTGDSGSAAAASPARPPSSGEGQ